jgi:hypothetical protein
VGAGAEDLGGVPLPCGVLRRGGGERGGAGDYFRRVLAHVRDDGEGGAAETQGMLCYCASYTIIRIHPSAMYTCNMREMMEKGGRQGRRICFLYYIVYNMHTRKVCCASMLLVLHRIFIICIHPSTIYTCNMCVMMGPGGRVYNGRRASITRSISFYDILTYA